MEIASLKLVNFRNFENLELNFSSNKNIIIGNNGVGKTNIVEAIFVLALTKSFRTNEDEVLIKTNSDLYKIEGTIKDTFINNYKVVYVDNIKTVKINNNKIKKLSDYISNIRVILFNINDLKLIKDTPSTRRKLLNLEISELDNSYLKYLNYYNKILKQRNSYLKIINKDSINEEYLGVIDNQLIDYGIKINQIRKDFINKINEKIYDIYYKLGGKTKLSVSYKSDYNDLDELKIREYYKKNIVKDINFKSTQFGIHRDDFIFKSDDNEFILYGSEGQQKNAIISFKLAEIEVFKNITNTYPILILDDLFSELDIKTVEKILNYISDDIQTFITTTDLKKIKKKYLKGVKKFEIKDGIVREEYYE